MRACTPTSFLYAALVAVGGIASAAHAAETDPVNRQQAAALASALGGGATFDVATGIFNPPSYLVLGNHYNTVGDALGALGTATAAQATLGSYTTNTSAATASKGALSLGCSQCAVDARYQQGNSSIAIGAGPTVDASGSYSNTATARGQGSVAIGGDAVGANALAVKGTAGGVGSIALQGSTSAASDGSVALRGDITDNIQGIAIGGTLASGNGGVQLGANGHSAGNGTALGSGSNAADGSAALGANASTVATSPFDGGTGVAGQLALGASAKAENSAIAIGSQALSLGFQGLAVGSNAKVAAGVANGVALGLGAQIVAGADNSVALGANSQTARANVVEVGGRQVSGLAAGTQATDAVNVKQLDDAIGGIQPGGSVPWIASTDTTAAQAQGIRGTALGANATAGSTATAFNTAVGSGSIAGTTGSADDGTGGQATAVGADAQANGAQSSALGQGARATAARATAIGAGAVADQVGTVSFGSTALPSRLVNVAPGVADTDAVTVGQLAPYAAALGGAASMAGGSFRAPTYSLSSGIYHDVGSALTALDQKPNGGGTDPLWLASNDSATAAIAPGLNSTAVGAGANSAGSNSVALGAGSVAADDGTVSIGNAAAGMTRRLVNLADGVAPADAVTMRQAQNITAIFGSGASLYNNLTPTYIFTSPGAAGTYKDVGAALSALDNGLNAVNQRVDNLPPGSGGATGPQGAQGPKGDKGDTGAAGPQGPAGQGAGRDALAIHYDNATQTTATLGGNGGTTVKNVRAGQADTDAANVGQINQAIASAKSYADEGDQRTLSWANQYTDQRLRGMSRRIDQAGAVGSVFGQMALSAGAIPQQDKLSMGASSYRGASAIGVAYTHRFENDRVAVAVGGAFAGSGTSLGISVSVGIGD